MKIKQLKFRQLTNWFWVASSPFGKFYIEQNTLNKYTWEFNECERGPNETFDECKHQCQSHFESLIDSCFENTEKLNER